MITITATITNGMTRVIAQKTGEIDVADEAALKMLIGALGHPENDVQRAARNLLNQVGQELNSKP